MRSTFAGKAEELIFGDREQTYDDPNRNFRRIAQCWSAILNTEVTMRQVALMMTMLKLVREGHRHQDDNIIDAHGYLMCLERIINEELDRESVPQLENVSDGSNGAESWAMHDRLPPVGPRNVHTSAPILTRRPPVDRDALDMG